MLVGVSGLYYYYYSGAIINRPPSTHTPLPLQFENNWLLRRIEYKEHVEDVAFLSLHHQNRYSCNRYANTRRVAGLIEAIEADDSRRVSSGELG